jgi:hypothetical protein
MNAPPGVFARQLGARSRRHLGKPGRQLGTPTRRRGVRGVFGTGGSDGRLLPSRPNFGTERAQQVGAPPRRDLTNMGRHLRAPPRGDALCRAPYRRRFCSTPPPSPSLTPSAAGHAPWGHAQDVRVRRAPAEGPKLPGTLVRGVPGQPARCKPGQAGSPPRHWQAILTR